MPKFKTVAIDPIGELARLYFSNEMKKHSKDTETIRQVFHYPGVTERLNMLFRRFTDLKKRGVNVVVLGHEQIEKIYPKGGAIAQKGQQAPEPITVKGRPDLPGTSAPEELCRKCDNIFRMRSVSGKPTWVGKREFMAADIPWDVRDGFNAPEINGGYFEPSFTDVKAKVLASPYGKFWQEAYIWLIYGAFGIGKTRSLLTFPRPLLLFDLDRKSYVLGDAIKPGEIEVVELNPEECDDYTTFLSHFERSFV